jgi:hypothetical protein
MLGQIAFALYLSLHAVSKFYFYLVPYFPIVVLRGHISPRLCSWSQCEGTRKTVRQAYRGSLSLYLGYMCISLCFTSFYCIYNPLVPQTRFSPLSLQFSIRVSVYSYKFSKIEEIKLDRNENKDSVVEQLTSGGI